jgi:hypothetical protein
MTAPDEDLKRALQKWIVPALDDAHSDRMIAHALGQPQQRPWQRALTEWRYAIGYKLAALAGCAALGLGLGLGIGMAAGETLDIAGVALMTSVGG